MKTNYIIECWFDKNDEIYEIYNPRKKKDCHLIEFISLIEIDEIINFIFEKSKRELLPRDIPIFSSFINCTNNLCIILDTMDNEGTTMEELGALLLGYDAKPMAYYKYGETHAKTAEFLGLVKLVKCERVQKAYLTNLGYYYITHPNEQTKLITRMLLKIDIIQEILKNYYLFNNTCVQTLLLNLSFKTQVRRMTNVKKLITILGETNEYNFDTFIDNLDFTCKEDEAA